MSLIDIITIISSIAGILALLLTMQNNYISKMFNAVNKRIDDIITNYVNRHRDGDK